MIPVLFFFGLCVFGIGDCEDTPTFQEEMNQLIELAFDCGQSNGTTNWIPEGNFGGTLQCIKSFPEHTYNGYVPQFTKSYSTLDDTVLLNDNGSICYYKQVNGEWEISYCEERQEQGSVSY